MKRLLLVIALLSASASARAEVSPEIHALCKEAKDYVGCVQAMTSNSAATTGRTSTLRVVEGERELTGNSCPEGFAYAGAGWCSNVICISRASGHSPGLGGKNWKCGSFLGMGYAISWGDQRVKATNDPSCPADAPEVGWTSSSEQRDWIPED